MDDDALIARYIEKDPIRRGNAEARLVGAHMHVWALVGALPVVDGDPRRLAEEYDVPFQAVRAALAYYARHQEAIDDRIAAKLPAAS